MIVHIRLTRLLMMCLALGTLSLARADSCLNGEDQVVPPRVQATTGSFEPRFLGQWGSEGSEPGEFHFPIGIAVNDVDEMFVTDFYNDRVQKFSTDGKLLAVISVLPTPGGIALSSLLKKPVALTALLYSSGRHLKMVTKGVCGVAGKA